MGIPKTISVTELDGGTFGLAPTRHSPICYCPSAGYPLSSSGKPEEPGSGAGAGVAQTGAVSYA